MKRTEVVVRIEDEALEAIDVYLENGILSFNEYLNHIINLHFGLV